MTLAPEGQLDPAVVAALYLEHAEGLRRFLLGVLRDPQLAADALQNTFTKAVEVGGKTQEESRKAWLFRVAYHEALALKRKQKVAHKAFQALALLGGEEGEAAEHSAIRHETIQIVRAALDTLPETQAEVVRLRIYQGKKFAEIATELNVPLGTVLGRMRSALAKLRRHLDGEDGTD